MAVPIPYVHVGMGLICTIGSIPLALRMVPMNRIFGIRLEKAYASSENWYALNAFGGTLILGFGLFLLGFSYLLHDRAPPPSSIWAPVYLLAPLLGIIPLVGGIKLYAIRLPG
jgi:uncharacterized membrane protein